MKSLDTIVAAVAVFMLFSCGKEPTIADPISPVVLEKGAFLSGRVIDTEGNPVGNVAVTDGFVWSQTDADGRYRFESPYPERVRFVSVSFPSDYNPVCRDGRPVFWSSVTSWQGLERTADIVLEKCESPGDDFTMLMMADPQAREYRASSNAENLAYATKDIWEDVFADMRTMISETGGSVYGLCLGDVSQQPLTVYPQYCIGMASLEIPFFQVIGNHDHIYPDKETDDEAAYPFESMFGPRNYSFNLGCFHFVVLDNCIYDKEQDGYPFVYGFEDETLVWLKEDLSNVSKDTPVMICMHANVLSAADGVCTGDGFYNTVEFMQTIQGFEKLYVWMGHLHVCDFMGTVESPYNTSGVEAFTLPRVAGQMPGNLSYNSDGSPRGYVIFDIKGKDISWRYRPVKESSAPYRGSGQPPVFQWQDIAEDAQIHVYPRGSYDDDFVYANVFLWDKHWEIPQLSVGGQNIPMVRDCCYDLAFKENIQFYRNKVADNSTLDPYWGKGKRHTFRARVPDGASGVGVVSVVDRFGQTWSQEISVAPIHYNDGLYHVAFDFRKAPYGCPSVSSSDLDLSCDSDGVTWSMKLSCGYYAPGEDGEGAVVLDGANSSLILPALPGYKLVGVTVHTSGNRMASCKASVADMSGSMPVGGNAIVFWGDCGDSWSLEDTADGVSYKLVSETSSFRIGELRLAYRSISAVNCSGSSNDYIVDDGVIFN